MHASAELDEAIRSWATCLPQFRELSRIHPQHTSGFLALRLPVIDNVVAC